MTRIVAYGVAFESASGGKWRSTDGRIEVFSYILARGRGRYACHVDGLPILGAAKPRGSGFVPARRFKSLDGAIRAGIRSVRVRGAKCV